LRASCPLLRPPAISQQALRSRRSEPRVRKMLGHNKSSRWKHLSRLPPFGA
jgi:hypothetical protein